MRNEEVATDSNSQGMVITKRADEAVRVDAWHYVQDLTRRSERREQSSKDTLISYTSERERRGKVF